jgi:hypothetical protein
MVPVSRPVAPALAALTLAALTLAAACYGSAPPSARSSPATSAPTPASAASYPPCSQVTSVPAGTRWTVASGLDRPDDVLYAGGQLYVAVLGSGGIEVLASGRPAATLPVHIADVEGMAFIGSDFYAAGQARDAVYQVSGPALRRVIQLAPVAGQDGVDGIAAQEGLLVVPDSPRGVVDWVDPATGAIRRQLTGFVRPTGAWPLPDGGVLIADEYGNAVVRVTSAGARTYLTRDLPIADDVAEDSQGAVFAVAPVAGGGRLAQVLSGGGVNDVLTGLAAPQGLAVDGADNLYFTEEDAGRVDLLVRTFKLAPLPAVRASSRQPVCVQVRRAPGFTAPITLSGGSRLQVLSQPGSGDVASLLVTGCPTGCQLTARAGARTDVMWVRTAGS